MSHRAIRHKMIIAVFAVGLTLAGGAQAGGLYTGGGLALPSGEVDSESLLSQAWSWVSGLWESLFSVAVEKDSAPVPPPPDDTSGSGSTSCTNPEGCNSGDAGWGIDPNG